MLYAGFDEDTVLAETCVRTFGVIAGLRKPVLQPLRLGT